MKEDKIFIDSNILIYANDTSSQKKFEIAKNIVDDLWQSNKGVISTQVLQEFFNVITKKITQPIPIKTAKEIIGTLLKWHVVINDGEIILSAIDLHERHQISFWDAMIVQAAINAEAHVILSEDLTHGLVIDGVKIKNPFKDR